MAIQMIKEYFRIIIKIKKLKFANGIRHGVHNKARTQKVSNLWKNPNPAIVIFILILKPEIQSTFLTLTLTYDIVNLRSTRSYLVDISSYQCL